MLRSPFRKAALKVTPADRTHKVAGRELPLKVVENDRARRLTLRIAPGGTGLRVTVPPGLAPREIDRFLERHQNWLEERLKTLPEQALVRPGIKIPLRGMPHLIVHEPGKRGTVAVSWIGKLKTTLQMVALLLLLAFAPGTPIAILGVVTLYVSALLTLWSMIQYLRAAWPHLSRSM